MSVQAMTWAFDQAIPPGPKIVLLAVADRTWGKDGHWTIDWEELITRCSLSRRAIRRYLQQLEEHQLITLAPRYDQHTGMQLENLCIVNMHRIITDPTCWGQSYPQQQDVPPTTHGQGVVDGRGGVPSMATRGYHPRPPSSLNLNLNPSRSSLSSSESISERLRNVRAREAADATTDGEGTLGRISEISGRVLAHLNVKAHTQFTPYDPRGRPTADLTVIEAIVLDGYSEADCMRVIDSKVRQWKDAKDVSGRSFAASLRPSTLFAKSKFSTYLGECPKPLTSAKIIPLLVASPRPVTGISMREAFTDRPDLFGLLPLSLTKQFDGSLQQ